MTNTPPDNTPFRAEAGDSPSGADVPIWVTACVRLCSPAGGAADKAITAAQILLADRIRVYGQDRVVTTHADLAMFLEYSRRDKVKWVVDFLQQIRFLSIPERREAAIDDHGRRKPRRDENTRRTTADTFLVHERPPAGYAGPRTLHELRDALRENRRWSFDELFLDPSSELDFVTGQSCTPGRVQELTSLYPKSGTGEISPGQSCTPDEETSLKEGSFASFQRKEGSEASLRNRDAAPHREAGAVAGEHPDVWSTAKMAPWAAKGHDIHDNELAELVPAIAQTMQTRGLTLEQAREHLDQAVAKLTSRSARKRLEFVIKAFTEYAPAVAHPDQRPLPDLANSSSTTAANVAGGASSEQHLTEVGTEECEGTWCGECRPVRGRDGKPACRLTCTNHATAA